MRTDAQIMAAQLRGCVEDVVEAIDHVIGSREEEFALENFEDALRKLRGVRIMIEDEANKLDPNPAVPS